MTTQFCARCNSQFMVEIQPWVRREDLRHRDCPARPPWWQSVLWAIACVLLVALTAAVFAWILPNTANGQERCPSIADIPPPGSCTFVDGGEPTCAPGEVAPQFVGLTDAQLRPLLCGHSTQGARCKPSPAARKRLFAAYSLPWPPPPPDPDGEASYEVDHHILESIGGAQTWRNLWPQMARPRPGYHEKDLVEADLHRRFCAGTISAADARAVLTGDWRVEYARMQAAKEEASP